MRKNKYTRKVVSDFQKFVKAEQENIEYALFGKKDNKPKSNLSSKDIELLESFVSYCSQNKIACFDFNKGKYNINQLHFERKKTNLVLLRDEYKRK